VVLAEKEPIKVMNPAAPSNAKHGTSSEADRRCPMPINEVTILPSM
jgi:hypothetical protein